MDNEGHPTVQNPYSTKPFSNNSVCRAAPGFRRSAKYLILYLLFKEESINKRHKSKNYSNQKIRNYFMDKTA